MCSFHVLCSTGRLDSILLPWLGRSKDCMSVEDSCITIGISGILPVLAPYWVSLVPYQHCWAVSKPLQGLFSLWPLWSEMFWQPFVSLLLCTAQVFILVHNRDSDCSCISLLWGSETWSICEDLPSHQGNRRSWPQRPQAISLGLWSWLGKNLGERDCFGQTQTFPHGLNLS